MENQKLGYLSKTEINSHPDIVPTLEEWRKAREYRDRVERDNRFSERTKKEAEKAAREWEKKYDEAVRKLLFG